MPCSGMYTLCSMGKSKGFLRRTQSKLKSRKIADKMWGFGWFKGVRNNFLGDLTWKRSLPGRWVQEDRHPRQSVETGEPNASRVQHHEWEAARECRREKQGINTWTGIWPSWAIEQGFYSGTVDKMVFWRISLTPMMGGKNRLADQEAGSPIRNLQPLQRQENPGQEREEQTNSRDI